MPIRKLPPLLINQIAAGEVIERPASVVKELVENSLDAGAKHIDVAVEEGGRQLIRVGDDASGIAVDQLALAVAPHATSKLSATQDLAAIGTLGFRGEALASIASVSRLRITSRTADAESGHQLEAKGDHVTGPSPAGSAPGTIVEVRDLFFNTPARRKFMRSATTEFGHITDAVSRIAMVWPQIALTLTHNDRKYLELPTGQTRRDRCVQLLGNDLDEAMLEFESPAGSEMDDGGVWGLAGVPSIARSSSKYQHLFVNGRNVRDRNVAHAIKEAYRGLIPHDRQPVAVVILDLPADCVDVNVHPTKTEVRFRDPGRIHGLVLTALRQRLLGTDLTPSISIESPQRGFGLAGQNTTATPSAGGQMPTMAAAPPHVGSSVDRIAPETQTSAAPGSNLSARAFVDYFKQMDPTQKGFVYDQVKRAMTDDLPESMDRHDEDVAPQLEPSGRIGPMLAAQGVLQIHKSYLVTQDEQGMLIIDQHALHERVMFEQLRSRVLQGNLESQRLLMPVTVSAGAARIAALEKIAPLLQRIGIEAEPMGPGTIGIHAFASFLFDRKVEPAEMLEQLLDHAEDGQFDTRGEHAEEAAMHTLLDMMACKAAVKAGDQMSQQELADLLARREQVERSSACPHGRPTSIRLTLRDLEKHFKRT